MQDLKTGGSSLEGSEDSLGMDGLEGLDGSEGSEGL